MAVRGVAAFLGCFTLLNLAGGLGRAGFDCNLWWIDLRPLPEGVAAPVLLATAVALLVVAFRPPQAGWRRRAVIGLVGFAALAALANVVQFYALLAAGRFRAGVPVPMSAVICGALAWVAAAAARRTEAAGPPPKRWRRVATFAAAFAACAVVFPLAQMLLFGSTDYRRKADAAVVFGARAYADGRPSLALADRVQTAVRLYHEGYVDRLVFSGGPGDGAVHETESMRRMAVNMGVPPDALVLDADGVSTAATVDGTAPILDRLNARRVLAVSHGYHLPRVKMTYRRAGREVYTVPAQETRRLAKLPLLVAREVVALWAYYLRPLVRRDTLDVTQTPADVDGCAR